MRKKIKCELCGNQAISKVEIENKDFEKQGISKLYKCEVCGNKFYVLSKLIPKNKDD